MPVNVEDDIPGAVGERHGAVPFDPRRRASWKTERGMILMLMSNHPRIHYLAREMAEILGRNPNQTCTRVGELAAQNLIERTGRERLTSTGTPADEWQLTDVGIKVLGLRPRRIKLISSRRRLEP